MACATRSFAPRFTQLRHGARSFGAFGARCTQFCPTVHADEVRYTQFYAGLETIPTSSTCGFTASRSFRGLRNCVYRAPVACSAGQKVPEARQSACSVRQNCVYHAPTASTVRRRLAPGPNGRHIRFLAPIASSPTSPPRVSRTQPRQTCAGGLRQDPTAATSLSFLPASHTVGPASAETQPANRLARVKPILMLEATGALPLRLLFTPAGVSTSVIWAFVPSHEIDFTSSGQNRPFDPFSFASVKPSQGAHPIYLQLCLEAPRFVSRDRAKNPSKPHYASLA